MLRALRLQITVVCDRFIPFQALPPPYAESRQKSEPLSQAWDVGGRLVLTEELANLPAHHGHPQDVARQPPRTFSLTMESMSSQCGRYPRTTVVKPYRVQQNNSHLLPRTQDSKEASARRLAVTAVLYTARYEQLEWVSQMHPPGKLHERTA